MPRRSSSASSRTCSARTSTRSRPRRPISGSWPSSAGPRRSWRSASARTAARSPMRSGSSGSPSPSRRTSATGRLTMGHARALLGLPSPAAQLRLRERILSQDWSVRATEAGVQARRPGAAEGAPAPAGCGGASRRRSGWRLGTRVRIVGNLCAAGSSSPTPPPAELERIHGRLTSGPTPAELERIHARLTDSPPSS